MTRSTVVALALLLGCESGPSEFDKPSESAPKPKAKPSRSRAEPARPEPSYSVAEGVDYNAGRAAAERLVAFCSPHASIWPYAFVEVGAVDVDYDDEGVRLMWEIKADFDRAPQGLYDEHRGNVFWFRVSPDLSEIDATKSIAADACGIPLHQALLPMGGTEAAGDYGETAMRDGAAKAIATRVAAELAEGATGEATGKRGTTLRLTYPTCDGKEWDRLSEDDLVARWASRVAFTRFECHNGKRAWKTKIR